MIYATTNPPCARSSPFLAYPLHLNRKRLPTSRLTPLMQNFEQPTMPSNVQLPSAPSSCQWVSKCPNQSPFIKTTKQPKQSCQQEKCLREQNISVFSLPSVKNITTTETSKPRLNQQLACSPTLVPKQPPHLSSSVTTIGHPASASTLHPITHSSNTCVSPGSNENFSTSPTRNNFFLQ